MRAWTILLVLMLVACADRSVPVDSDPRAVKEAAALSYSSQKADFQVQELVTGLRHPWGLAFLPDGSMLVTEREGRLRRIGADGVVSAPLDGLPPVFVDGQAGLLDVAVSPGFASDGMVYVSFAQANLRGNLAGTAVARGRLKGNALESVAVIYSQEPKLSSGTHVGSRLAFDQAGNLYVTQGDNRVAAAAAQELDKLTGKLVRVHTDGKVPADNPFRNRDGARPEIWSYGHRNMQGAAINPVSGELWTTEHGPQGGDELNIPRAGLNYGWPVITHGIDYNGQPVAGSLGTTAPGMEQPVHYWKVSPGLSGMAFYTGDAFPHWQGNLFLGALATRELLRLELDGDKVVNEERLLGERRQRIRDVRQGPDGALYLLVDDADGKLLRLSPSSRQARN